MNKIAKIITIVLLAAIGGIIVWGIISRQSEKEVDYSSYDPQLVYVKDAKSKTTGYNDNIKIANAVEDAGFMPDLVKGGNLEDAKVVLVEYADYQCSGCAIVNPWVNKLLEEYEGQVVVVFRTYLIHQTSRSAIAAANAASLQGYWKPYADYLFAHQGEWGSAGSTERTNLFSKYFTLVAGEDGDLAKFKSDMASAEVAKKIDFDMGLGKLSDVHETPSLFYNGEFIDWKESTTEPLFLEFFRNFIDPLLAEQN